MCSRPEEKDGMTFACRTCDECIATRRHGWVARAMMEKTLHLHCLVVALTYDDSDQHNRDAAAMFQYSDIRAFLHRLRAAIRYLDPENCKVRFLCAGEQGDRDGRCHWHMVIYSSVDLCALGEIKRLKGGKRVVVTDRAEMMTLGNRKVRLNWSLWSHGFVTFQEPDQGGMNYVLSYCLKDQFTEEKSRETMRQAKAENFATGLFRMSKRPAIGEPWLWEKFDRLEERGAVLPSLNFKIPGFHGFYHPSGTFRKKILWSLVALNKRIVWATGANAPQWSTLLSSLEKNPPDLEILNGPSQEALENEQSIEASIGFRNREIAHNQTLAATRRRCGRVTPCRACLSEWSDSFLRSHGIGRREKIDHDGWQSVEYYELATPEKQGLDASRYERLGGINPHCREKGSKQARLAFPKSGA